MTELIIYDSYCRYCATVGVEPADFELWYQIRWTLALNWGPR